MNVGKNILELRKAKNVTQEALAAELGVTAAAVSKWENGYTLPDILMLCALADFFGVTTDELLGRHTKWHYAVIGAASEALGQQIAALAKEYGIMAKAVFTSHEEALELAKADPTIRYVISGFYSGWYRAEGNASALVSVHPTDEGILSGFQHCFENYLDHNEHLFIVN